MDTLKHEIAQGTNGNISFIEIYEVFPKVNGKEYRVVMFQIPAAVTATPTSWRGHCYGRDGESLGPLSDEERDRIKGQEKKDWSKQIVEGATINDLDRDVIRLARAKYKEKMNRQHISDEVDNMSDKVFLV